MEERRVIVYEMQEIMVQDLPYAFLAWPQFIPAYRTDRLSGWLNKIGGNASWMNDGSIIEAKGK